MERRHQAGLAAIFAIGISFAWGQTPTEPEPPKRLSLRRVTQLPRVDGKAEPLWDETELFSISLAGSTAERPRTVLFKAVLAGENLYFLARWSLEEAESPLLAWVANPAGEWAPVDPKRAKSHDYRGLRTLEWSVPLSTAVGTLQEGQELRLPGVVLADEANRRDLLRTVPFPMRFQGEGIRPEPETLQMGERAYQALCARCHTLDGSEIYWGAKSFRDLNERVDDLELWQNIRYGFADVNASGEKRLQALYVFLRSLKQPDSPANEG